MCMLCEWVMLNLLPAFVYCNQGFGSFNDICRITWIKNEWESKIKKKKKNQNQHIVDIDAW